MNETTCDDYECEGEKDHSHVGVQPHLRRVMAHGELIDGLTGETPHLTRADIEDDPGEGQGALNQ